MKAISKAVNHGTSDINDSLSAIKKSHHASAIADMVCAIADFEDAIKACGTDTRLATVKADLKEVNGILKGLSFYGSEWVSATSGTSGEIVSAVEKVLPYLDEALGELRNLKY